MREIIRKYQPFEHLNWHCMVIDNGTSQINIVLSNAANIIRSVYVMNSWKWLIRSIKYVTYAVVVNIFLCYNDASTHRWRSQQIFHNT